MYVYDTMYGIIAVNDSNPYFVFDEMANEVRT